MTTGKFFLPLAMILSLATPLRADLAAARAALGARDFPGALVQAEKIAVTHPYDAAMIAGRSHLELGQLDQALSAARRAKVARPGDSAALALEGVILTRQGRPRLALLVLRRALDKAKTPQQKSIARALIRQARAGLVWDVQLGFGIAPSTNLTKASTADTITVLIPGTTTTTQAQLIGGQAKSGTGLRAFGQATRKLGSRTRLSFGLSGLYTEDPALRQGTAQVGLSFGKWSLTHAQARAGGARYAATTTLSFTHVKRLKKGQLILGASLADQRRFDDTDKSNLTRGVKLRYMQALSPRLLWDAGLKFEDRAAVSAFTAATHFGIDTGLRGAVAGTGWVLDGRLSLGWGQWDRLAVFEPVIRRDQSTTLSLSAQNNSISFYGLTPTYGLSVHQRDSNLDRHKIRSTDMFIGVANAF